MPGPGRQPRGMKAQVKNPGELFLRLMKYVLKDYKFHCISVVVLIVVSVLCNVQGTMFMKNLIDEYITPFLLSDNPNFTPLAHAIAKVAAFYALGVLATFGYNRLMVNVTQGTLRNLRNDLFSHMEKLPIKYFDTHAHGDIMSVYTNDIDTLRQMISQSMPQLLNSGITIVSVFISMLILSIPAYYRNDDHGRNHGILFEEICRTERGIFCKTAERPGNCERLHRRDDERAEGRKGVLS